VLGSLAIPFAPLGAGELLELPRIWTLGFLDGAWQADRGSVDAGGAGPGWGHVVFPLDSGAKVGPGSLLWLDLADNTILVWDVEGSALHSLAPAAGWAMAGAGYWGGWIYWAETEGEDYATGRFRTRLRRARADLTAVEVVSTYDPLPFPISLLASPIGWALTPQAAHFTVHWIDDVQGEQSGDLTVRLPLDAGTPTEGLHTGEPPTIGQPEAGGGSIEHYGGALHRVPDDVDGVGVVHWPTTGGWILHTSTRSLATNAAGSEAAVYADDGFGVLTLIRSPVAGPFGADPPVRFAVQSNPSGTPEIMGVAG
jgi:hypothetical protein